MRTPVRAQEHGLPWRAGSGGPAYGEEVRHWFKIKVKWVILPIILGTPWKQFSFYSENKILALGHSRKWSCFLFLWWTRCLAPTWFLVM